MTQNLRINYRTVAKLVAAVMFALLVVGALMVVDWSIHGAWPVLSSSGWPEELDGAMYQLPLEDQAEIDRFKVYRRLTFTDDEYVWQASGSRKLFDALTAGYNTRPVPREDVLSEFFSVWPWLRRPSPNAECEYAITPGFPTTERRLRISGHNVDGLYLVAMYDPRTQTTFVWSKSNLR